MTLQVGKYKKPKLHDLRKSRESMVLSPNNRNSKSITNTEEDHHCHGHRNRISASNSASDIHLPEHDPKITGKHKLKWKKGGGRTYKSTVLR
jgi:hypothetical protein